MKERPSILLLVSAVAYFAAALPLLFAPEELLALAGGEVSRLAVGSLQVLGSALFGFAMLNWMQRHSRIGGIFGRPVVVANLGHAGSAALLLAPIALRSEASPPLLIALAVYAPLAIAFGAKFFLRPRMVEQQEALGGLSTGERP